VAAAIIYWAISLVVELLSKLFETHLNHKFFATA
jgi:ABC-type amino acid transport system permease subunit